MSTLYEEGKVQFLKLSNDLEWYDILYHMYDEPGRHYHTMTHVLDLLRKLEYHLVEEARFKDNFNAIRYAIWFHDARYNPLAYDNEEKSATLFKLFALERFDEPFVAKVNMMILATKTHNIDKIKESLSNVDRLHLMLFLDLDLSILADQFVTYSIYCFNIRKEYKEVSEYWKKRIYFLNDILQQRKIFYTEGLFDEEVARKNMKWEITLLNSSWADSLGVTTETWEME